MAKKNPSTKKKSKKKKVKLKRPGKKILANLAKKEMSEAVKAVTTKSKYKWWNQITTPEELASNMERAPQRGICTLRGFMGEQGISESRFYELIKESPDLAEAVRVFKLKIEHALTGIAMQQAIGQNKGSSSMLSFILKNTIRWMDRVEIIEDDVDEVEFVG